MLQIIPLSQAVSLLKQGNIFAFPTETSYGIAGDPRSSSAVDAIYFLKKRDPAKSLPLIASSIEQVASVAAFDEVTEKLADEFWPGPLTLILPVRSGIALRPECVVDDHIAIRVSSNEIARTLADALSFPIIATSANESGQPECRTAEELYAAFGDTLPILDGGSLGAHKPSTIVRVHDDGTVSILREGAIPGSTITAFVRESP